MIYVFYFFAAVLVWLSFKSFRGGIAYLNFFRTELARPRPEFTPFVSVIAPCRGLDAGLEGNLSALVDQDFPEYEVIFVVDDAEDEAVKIIEDVSRKAEKDAKIAKTKLVVARKSAASSQKVENLREAVLHADDRSQVWVFVDSDARPSPDWLRYLVAPLADKDVGAATGYRWFISKRANFASELRSVWNASIASALGPNARSNFCWGGSTAIRREIFERLDIREKWKGTLSDDFTLTHAVKAAGMPIVFVPQALNASVDDCTFGEMLEFTTRQMKITRVYAPPLWMMSLFGSMVFNGVMLAGLYIVIFSRQNTVPVYVSIGALALVSIFSTGKAWLRLMAVRLALPAYGAELRRQSITQNTLWLIAPAIFLYNSLAALYSRRLTWRGIVYELKSPTETVIIAD